MKVNIPLEVQQFLSENKGVWFSVDESDGSLNVCRRTPFEFKARKILEGIKIDAEMGELAVLENDPLRGIVFRFKVIRLKLSDLLKKDEEHG